MHDFPTPLDFVQNSRDSSSGSIGWGVRWIPSLHIVADYYRTVSVHVNLYCVMLEIPRTALVNELAKSLAPFGGP